MTIPTQDKSKLQRFLNDPTITLPIVMVVLHRVITLMIAFYAVSTSPVVNPYKDAPLFVASLHGVQLQSPFHPFIEPWQRWDTGYYLKIAIAGYAPDDGTIAFQPIYPLLIRTVSLLTGDTLLAALIVSTLCEFIVLVLLAKLTAHDFHRSRLAFNTLLAIIVFPTAFYLLAGYTESLFLACSIGAFFAARRERWWLAALMISLATLTRIQGIVLIVPVGWMAFDGLNILHTFRSSKPSQLVARFAPVIAGPATVVAIVIGLYISGMGNYYQEYSKLWKVDARFPGVVLIDLVGEITAGKATFSEYGSLITVVFLITSGVIGLRRLPAAYSLYTWSTLIILLISYHRDNLNLMNSFMRYALHFFPAFIMLGMFNSRFPRLRIVIAALSILIQVALLFIFARWGWVA